MKQVMAATKKMEVEAQNMDATVAEKRVKSYPWQKAEEMINKIESMLPSFQSNAKTKNPVSTKQDEPSIRNIIKNMFKFPENTPTGK